MLILKFLPGDEKKYREYIKDGGHMNNSSDYKEYDKSLEQEKEICFYNENISTTITNFLNCSKNLL